MKFLIIDGKIAEISEIDLDVITGATSYLSQKAWFGFGGIPLFFENMELIKEQAEALKLPFPEVFEDTREMFRLVKRMLNKNKYYRSGLVHFQVFWNSSTVQTITSSVAFPNFDFPVSNEGLLLCFSKQKKYSGNTFNRYPFFNKTLWEAAHAEIRFSLFHQGIILNEKNAVCECASANIYLITGNELIFPSLKSGSYEDVLRPVVLKVAAAAGLKISEQETVLQSDLFETDEIFLASEEYGIQWVLGIENKRFIHYFSKIIHEKINEYLKKKSIN